MRYIVGNWKMNLGEAESAALARAAVEIAEKHRNVETWIAPSFLAIPAVSKIVSGSRVKLGSQTIHGEVKGAFTGEVSCSMLREFGGTFALIGHSERRWILGETDSVVSRKAKGAIDQDILPVFCVGENLEERERGLTHEILRRQLTALIEAVGKDALGRVIVAYEPCWAIGTGKTATVDTIADAHTAIRKICSDGAGAPKAILYGGSVTPENLSEILSVPDVDGGLIGGASLKADSFAKLVALASKD